MKLDFTDSFILNNLMQHSKNSGKDIFSKSFSEDIYVSRNTAEICFTRMPHWASLFQTLIFWMYDKFHQNFWKYDLDSVLRKISGL